MIATVSKANSTPLALWLEERFKTWSEDKPRQKRTLTAFSVEIGVPYDTFFNYLNKGGKPEGDNLKKIARKLGYEVYDILGLERPDPRLDRIEELWPLLTEASKKRIAEQINEYASKRQ